MRSKSLFSSLLLAATIITTPIVHAMETFTVDPAHSYVSWQISHLGFSTFTGKWFVNEGTLDLDKKKPQDSKVNVTIKVADMVTGIPKLDEHLKSEEFFDVAKYPTATFASNKITMTGKNAAKIQGMLTVHGVTKSVTLNAKLNKMDVSPITNKLTAGFSATTIIKRSDYGMKAYLPALGDEVKLTIEVEANKAN